MSAFAFLVTAAAQVGGDGTFATQAAADLARQGWESGETEVGVGGRVVPLKQGENDVLAHRPGPQKEV